MEFIVTLRHRDGSTKTWTTEGNCGNCWRDNSLEDALLEILWQTMDEDDTGYFFVASEADEEYINSHDNFHYVNYYDPNPYFDEEFICDVVSYEQK